MNRDFLVCEQLGDAADCMGEATETLRHLAKLVPEQFASRIRQVINEIALARSHVTKLKSDVHVDSFTTVNSVFDVHLSMRGPISLNVTPQLVNTEL